MDTYPPLPVTLTWEDIRLAAHKGVDRNVNAHRDSRKSLFYPYTDPELWKACIGGMIGEMVACKLLGVPFDPEVDKPDTHVGDVGCLQVRFTQRDPLYLDIYGKDPEDDVYALTTGRLTRNGHPPVYHVHGWAKAHEVRAIGGATDKGHHLHASRLHDPQDLVTYKHRLQPRRRG